MRTISSMSGYLPRNDQNTGDEIAQGVLGMVAQIPTM